MSAELRAWLARNVRKARTSLGISQDELAERAGLHRTYVGGIERSERNISLGSLSKLAIALEVSAADLISNPQALPND